MARDFNTNFFVEAYFSIPFLVGSSQMPTENICSSFLTPREKLITMGSCPYIIIIIIRHMLSKTTKHHFTIKNR